MTDSKSSLVFFAPIEVPDRWTLYDVLLWVAAKKVPVAWYDEKGVELRESTELFYDDMFSWGLRFDRVFETVETEYMGLKKSPTMIEHEFETKTGKYLHSAEFWRRPFAYDDPDIQEKHDLEAAEMLPISEAHDEYSIQWEADFENYLDEYTSEIHIQLKSGNLKGRAIFIAEAIDDEWYDAGYEVLDSNLGKEKSLYSNVPKRAWFSKNIDWEGCFLNFGDGRFFGITFLADDILALFPPNPKSQRELFSDGLSVFENRGKKIEKPLNKLRGRPTKNWEAVNLRIAEMIKNEGHLPDKQDALAQDLVDWYEAKFRQKIGLSTVKSRLKPYYENGSFQKS